MNTNPSAKRILCFGDSNTWGHIPNPGKSDRYPSNVRWTGASTMYIGGTEKSKKLGALYEKIAVKYGCGFLGALKTVETSEKDGLHLEPKEHKKLAEAIRSKIKQMQV